MKALIYGAIMAAVVAGENAFCFNQKFNSVSGAPIPRNYGKKKKKKRRKK